MTKRSDSGELSAEQAVERVRELARKLGKRLEKNDEAEALYDDPALLEGSKLLARPNVPFEAVAKLARSDSAAEKYIGLAAIDLRRDAPPEWLDAAIRRLHAAWENELAFLLRTLVHASSDPLIARVLLQADHDWVTDPNLRRVVAFVQDRARQGEELAGSQFDGLARHHVEHANEVVAAARDELPEQVVRAYRRWSRTEFLRPFAALWELPPPGESPALVGARKLVIDELVAALQQLRPHDGGPAGPRHSVLLVGEHGVGKSSLLREAVRRVAQPDWIVFEAGAPAVMAGQVYIGELEGRVQELIDRARDWPLVWVLPNLEEALYAGQHSRSPQGLLDAILPHIESGELVVVGELRPAALESLLKERPRIAGAFTTVRVGALDEAETRAAARAWAADLDVEVPDDVLAEAQELAAHYLSGMAMPGALLRLLRAAVRREESGEVGDPVRLDGEAIVDTLADATGLPLHILDPRSSLDLAEVRAFLGQRVLGQPEAVDCLVERIALIKAGLTDPTRPLGVFLFVGPTGTGKTELAKALAEYVFGSAARLVRLDMTEFQTPASLERLLSDRSTEAQAAPLIAAVRQNPFSVVLLDEFEKAHENVWDVFLQVFDDGRLTDRSGATTDFRHCVVILTSNVGSAIASGPGTGFATETGSFRAAGVERAVTQAFKPELLNRLDRVVVFGPLEREHMRTLLEHELQAVMERRGLRSRGWVVESDAAALELLLDKGFSRELGARPLKRAVEREVLAPLATAIVGRAVPEGDRFLVLTARDGAIDVSFVDPDASDEELAPVPVDDRLTLPRIVADPRGLPTELALLRDELERVRLTAWSTAGKDELLARTRTDGFWDHPQHHDVLAMIEVLDRADAMNRFADDLLARLDASAGRSASPSAYLVGLLADRIYLLDRARADVEAGRTGDAFVSIRVADAGTSGSAEFAADLRAMLDGWSERRGMRITPLGDGMLAVAGLGAHAILAPEAGLHVLELPGRNARTFARATTQLAVAPWPPGLITETELRAAARTALANRTAAQSVVRRYRREPSPLVRDTVRGRTGRLDRVLGGEFDVIP